MGEMVGAFVGDLLYYTIVERDPKKAFGMLKDTVLGIFGFLKKIPILGDLIRIFQEGGNVIGNFGKWLFLEAIPWAAAKIGGIGKIISDWLGSGIDRWKSTFPMFEIPNVGIQDLLYKIMDATWPKWVTDLGIAGWKPFGHLEDKPIFEWLAGERPEWLEGLPRLPRVLGWMWQHVPGLSSLVDSDGEVKGFPKFWLLGNPLFMMSHTKNAFFPGQGGGTAAEPTGGGGSSSSTSIPASISEGGGGIDTSGLDQQHQELISANQTNGYAGVMEQIESYAPYEDIASTTNIVVPAPPSTGQPPGGAQSPGGIMIAGGGGTDDAFEVLEAFG